MVAAGHNKGHVVCWISAHGRHPILAALIHSINLPRCWQAPAQVLPSSPGMRFDFQSILGSVVRPARSTVSARPLQQRSRYRFGAPCPGDHADVNHPGQTGLNPGCCRSSSIPSPDTQYCTAFWASSGVPGITKEVAGAARQNRLRHLLAGGFGPSGYDLRLALRFHAHRATCSMSITALHFIHKGHNIQPYRQYFPHCLASSSMYWHRRVFAAYAPVIIRYSPAWPIITNFPITPSVSSLLHPEQLGDKAIRITYVTEEKEEGRTLSGSFHRH